MHFNAAAEQWARAKHNGVDVESINEQAVWPAGAPLPPDPKGHQPLPFYFIHLSWLTHENA